MTAEEIIKKHIEGWSGLQKTSIEHFYKTGKVSGTFYKAIKHMLEEYSFQKEKEAFQSGRLRKPGYMSPRMWQHKNFEDYKKQK